MPISSPLYDQLLSLLSQHSQYRDWRHLKALAWMVNALICSGKINLSEWESYVVSRATKAQSTERRWQRFVRNHRIKVRSMYVPLVMAAINDWTKQRIYLALGTFSKSLGTRTKVIIKLSRHHAVSRSWIR